MTTEQLLFQARMAVINARDDEVIIWIGVIVLACVMVLSLHYVSERWSFVPRKRHDGRKFIERF